MQALLKSNKKSIVDKGDAAGQRFEPPHVHTRTHTLVFVLHVQPPRCVFLAHVLFLFKTQPRKKVESLLCWALSAGKVHIVRA